MSVMLSLRKPPKGFTGVWLDAREHTVSNFGMTVKLHPKTWLIAAALNAIERRLSSAELIDHVYGECEDGGPTRAKAIVAVCISRARKQLAPLGFDTVTDWGQGWTGWFETVPERRAA